MTQGMDLRQFRDYIVGPTLREMGCYSPAAEKLLLGTALAESGLRYIDQVDKAGRPGPAYGVYQMEAATHDDIWNNFLRDEISLAARVRHQTMIKKDLVLQMHGNHFYATAMCRVHYLRVPRPLPEADDFDGLAAYWKQHYNTRLGSGSVEGFKAKAAAIMAL